MLVATLSATTGIGESTLRLLLTILFAYPIAFAYRATLLRPLNITYAPAVRNAFVLASGLALSWFYNGPDIVHSLATTVVSWLLCLVGGAIGSRRLAAAAVFAFNLGYLLLGYHYTATDEYDICWTMTQCILCLRMIGFAMDYMDGENLLKKDNNNGQKVKIAEDSEGLAKGRADADADMPRINGGAKMHVAKGDAMHASVNPTVESRQPKQPTSFERNIGLPTLPSLLETLGYAHFFGAFLVGPQFSFSLYRKFITMSLYPDPADVPQGSQRYAARCFLTGVAYLALQQAGAILFPLSHLMTVEYAQRQLHERLIYMWFVGKIVFTKYIGVWMLVEGACTISGISFNGFDKSGRPEWNGLANVDRGRFETATSLTEIINSFNTNTNLWSKLYVFKRMIFLGNKMLSSVVVLFFLAIWHGTHPGYFAAFFLEFLDVEAERRLSRRLKPFVAPLYDPKNRDRVLYRVMRTLHMAACYIAQSCALHYAMVSFELLAWNRFMRVWSSVHYVGHVIVFALLLADNLLPKPKGHADEKRETAPARVNGNVRFINHAKIE